MSTNQAFGRTDPSLNLRVTDVQRDRVVGFLQQAYVEGRLDSVDFDRRLDLALKAVTRAELDEAYRGVRSASLASSAIEYRPAARPAQSDLGAGMAHWLNIPFPIVAPGVMYLVAPRGSHARVEAAKAINFGLTMMVTMVAGAIAAMVVDELAVIAVVAFVGFLVTEIIAGFRAYNGEDWKNPISKYLNIKAVDPSQDRRAIGR